MAKGSGIDVGAKQKWRQNIVGSFDLAGVRESGVQRTRPVRNRKPLNVIDLNQRAQCGLKQISRGSFVEERRCPTQQTEPG